MAQAYHGLLEQANSNRIKCSSVPDILSDSSIATIGSPGSPGEDASQRSFCVRPSMITDLANEDLKNHSQSEPNLFAANDQQAVLAESFLTQKQSDIVKQFISKIEKGDRNWAVVSDINKFSNGFREDAKSKPPYEMFLNMHQALENMTNHIYRTCYELLIKRAAPTKYVSQESKKHIKKMKSSIRAGLETLLFVPATKSVLNRSYIRRLSKVMDSLTHAYIEEVSTAHDLFSTKYMMSSKTRKMSMKKIEESKEITTAVELLRNMDKENGTVNENLKKLMSVYQLIADLWDQHLFSKRQDRQESNDDMEDVLLRQKKMMPTIKYVIVKANPRQLYSKIKHIELTAVVDESSSAGWAMINRALQEILPNDRSRHASDDIFAFLHETGNAIETTQSEVGRKKEVGKNWHGGKLPNYIDVLELLKIKDWWWLGEFIQTSIHKFNSNTLEVAPGRETCMLEDLRDLIDTVTNELYSNHYQQKAMLSVSNVHDYLRQGDNPKRPRRATITTVMEGKSSFFDLSLESFSPSSKNTEQRRKSLMRKKRIEANYLEETQAAVREAVGRILHVGVYDYLFMFLREDGVDEMVRKYMWSLKQTNSALEASGLELEHFKMSSEEELKEKLQKTNVYGHLKALCKSRTQEDKFSILFEVIQAAQDVSESFGADTLVPSLIYAILTAEPFDVYANFYYLDPNVCFEYFLPEDLGQGGMNLITFTTVCDYIRRSAQNAEYAQTLIHALHAIPGADQQAPQSVIAAQNLDVSLEKKNSNDVHQQWINFLNIHGYTNPTKETIIPKYSYLNMQVDNKRINDHFPGIEKMKLLGMLQDFVTAKMHSDVISAIGHKSGLMQRPSSSSSASDIARGSEGYGISLECIDALSPKQLDNSDLSFTFASSNGLSDLSRSDLENGLAPQLNVQRPDLSLESIFVLHHNNSSRPRGPKKRRPTLKAFRHDSESSGELVLANSFTRDPDSASFILDSLDDISTRTKSFSNAN